LRILFINKYDTVGGAGIAAFRLHEALHNQFNSTNCFLVGIKKSNYDYIIPTRRHGLENFIERGLNFIFNQAGLQYFYHPFSTKNIIKFTKDFLPDIISVHNIHGGYFKTSLLKEISEIAPVVWTLHDMWAFTANAAYTFGDESWKNFKAGKNEKKYFPQIGLQTGDWLLRRKKDIYSKSNLTIVTPSHWLTDMAKQSPIFKDKEIVTIHNGIDLNVFYPRNKKVIRERLGIKNGEKAVVFIAEKMSSSIRKGSKDLVNILKILNKDINNKIHLISVGQSNPGFLGNCKNFILHETGYIYEQEKLAEFLSAGDVFVLPTRDDNLPTTLIEASACGIPSVAYDVGGCKEIVEDGKNGYIIKPFNSNAFAEKIRNIIEDEEQWSNLSGNSKQIAAEKFDVKLMAKNYYSLFETLVQQTD